MVLRYIKLNVSGKLIFRSGKLRVSELFFEVPKDYANPSLGSLRLFARSVVKHETPAVPLSDEEQKKSSQKPWFVYLQGGPGFGCKPPQSMSLTNHVLERGYQMLWLDQRGTGLSSPITAATLALQGDAKKQAEYLKMFRADNIVRDCEAIRKSLTSDYPAELKKWSIFGQSFGGFCGFTYLSKYPEGLREVFTSGGVPPIRKTAEDVYHAAFKQVLKRNEAYYNKFPEDIEHVYNIASHVQFKDSIKLPSGGKLTVPRFLTIGIAFGGAEGLDDVHNMVLRMRADIANFSFLTRPTLSAFESMTSYDDAVIYSVLHEPIYCSGGGPSSWAADKVGKSLKEFHWLADKAIDTQSRSQPLHFAGEMIFPFFFDTHSELNNLKEVADILATTTDWPELYNETQLAQNEVPVYCATFVDDMYVDFGLVQETVSKVKGVKQFITNRMYHGAVRTNTDDLVKGLFGLKEDPID